MSHAHPTHLCVRCCGFVLDGVHWVWDALVVLLMAFLGAVFLGHRPRACKPTEVNTSSGECHGCGRARHYYNPRWFTVLCREAMTQTEDDVETCLCRMGNDARFALPVGVSMPLVGAIALLLLVGVLTFLCAIEVIIPPWTLEKPKRPDRPPITLERLLVGKERIEEERRNAVKNPRKEQQPEKPPPRTAAGTRMAREAEYKRVPSALERFRKIKSGPTEKLKTTRASRVPRPILRVPVAAPKSRSTAPPPDKDEAEAPADGKTEN
ncbi:MAG: hypothetical protein HN380_07080 [Victivallales bacterium]|nr:hypothetical protein [Victivallales bacterium]